MTRAVLVFSTSLEVSYNEADLFTNSLQLPDAACGKGHKNTWMGGERRRGGNG